MSNVQKLHMTSFFLMQKNVIHLHNTKQLLQLSLEENQFLKVYTINVSVAVLETELSSLWFRILFFYYTGSGPLGNFVPWNELVVRENSEVSFTSLLHAVLHVACKIVLVIPTFRHTAGVCFLALSS